MSKPLPPHLAASLEDDAREGARLARRLHALPEGTPQWHAANRACWRHSLGKMIDRYGLWDHWPTYWAAEKRYLAQEE